MIHINQVPLTDPEQKLIRQWIEHPGFAIYRKFLRSQSAEKLADSANALVIAEKNFDGTPGSDEVAAKESALEAKVLIAAEKMLEQVQAKDYKFYTIELKPGPITQ